jgi:site-specific recombinase XerD
MLRSTTLIGYTTKIAVFRRWWSDNGLLMQWQLRERDFHTFNRWLTHKSGLSYNSRKDVLRRMSQMFKWAFNRSYIKRDYGAWVPGPDGSAPLRAAAPVSALSRLIQSAADSDNPRRNQAILAIVIGTGMRRSECCYLNIEDICLAADGSGTIQIHHAKRVRGREVHGRIVVFDNHAGVYIRAYLDALSRDAGPLFPGRWRSRQMRPESLGRIVDSLIDTAGLKSQIQNLHDLRRMFITYFRQHKKSEGSDKLLRMQVGHSSAIMTDKYDLSGVEVLQDDFMSPFALMNRGVGK